MEPNVFMQKTKKPHLGRPSTPCIGLQSSLPLPLKPALVDQQGVTQPAGLGCGMNEGCSGPHVPYKMKVIPRGTLWGKTSSQPTVKDVPIN